MGIRVFRMFSQDTHYNYFVILPILYADDYLNTVHDPGPRFSQFFRRLKHL